MILLCSGTTVTWAHHALLHGDRKGLIQGLWCTILLGALFSSIQAYEYAHAPVRLQRAELWRGLLHGDRLPRLPRAGRHDLPDRASCAPIRATSPRKQHFGFEAAAWYWHFVDVVWLFLFMSSMSGAAGARSTADAGTAMTMKGRGGGATCCRAFSF
jgi:cytochrome c oxidase subunit 3